MIPNHQTQQPKALQHSGVSSLTSVQNQSDQQTQLANLLNSLMQNSRPIFSIENICHRDDQRSAHQQNLHIRNQSYQDKILNYNRKEKSLEQLSKKFIDEFEGRQHYVLELDKVTIKLKVERRRIYDIINILESLNVVKKTGKNNYLWRGLTQAINTISLCLQNLSNHTNETNKKEKSLEFLAAGFLRLFLMSKKAISLDEAAKYLIKNEEEAIIKTKIRRLYDIVNVFKSLGFVKKVQMDNRKPGFLWMGIEFLQNLIFQKQRDYEINPKDLEVEKCTEMTKMNERQQNSSFFTPVLQPKIEKVSPDLYGFMLAEKIKSLNDFGGAKEEEGHQKHRKQSYGHPTFFPTILQKSNSAFSYFNVNI